MTTLSMLDKEHKLKVVAQVKQLMDLNKRTVALLEKMKKPYLWQQEQLEAFLKNQRSLEQLQKMILAHKQILEEQKCSP